MNNKINLVNYYNTLKNPLNPNDLPKKKTLFDEFPIIKTNQI